MTPKIKTIEVYLDEKEARDYFSYLKNAISQAIKDSKNLPFHSILNEYFLDILTMVSNKQDVINSNYERIACLPKYQNDNKTKKYFDWVEIFRLIKFQYCRYSNRLVSYTESTYSSIPLLITKLIKDREIKIKALDMGCGPGRIMTELSDLYQNSFFYGIDYSFPVLYFANRIVTEGSILEFPDRILSDFDEPQKNDYASMTIKGFSRNNVQFGIADISEKLPFDDNSFDLVTATNSLNLSRDPDLSFNEAVRVTKKSGLIVVADLLGWKMDREPKRRIFADGASFYSYFKKRKDIEVIEYFYGGPYCEEYNGERMDVFVQHTICIRKK